MHRVVITGMGVIAPGGLSTEEAWARACSGESAVGTIRQFDASDLPVNIAAEVNDFDAVPLLGSKTARQTSRFVQFATAAAAEALKHSGYEADRDSENCGCLIGVAIGGLGEIENSSCLLRERGVGRVSPLTLPYAIPNMASGFVAIQQDLRGPNFSIATACASGSHAIGEAARLIQTGETKMMLAGGAEAAICPLSVASFSRMKALSRRNEDPSTASRPFDIERDGFVMGEGAGLLVLEELEHAKARGAEILAEVLGYGMSADAFHITAPAPGGRGLEQAIKKALNSSRVDPRTIHYINAHGTSTQANDELESAAITSVFGDHASALPVSSTKGVTGHCLGAAGGIEAAFTVMTIRSGVVPPTANHQHAGEECPLDYVPGQAREMQVRLALSNSSGFGGQNASLAFGKFTG